MYNFVAKLFAVAKSPFAMSLSTDFRVWVASFTYGKLLLFLAKPPIVPIFNNFPKIVHFMNYKVSKLLSRTFFCFGDNL